jgi:hypothetical protein
MPLPSRPMMTASTHYLTGRLALRVERVEQGPGVFCAGESHQAGGETSDLS